MPALMHSAFVGRLEQADQQLHGFVHFRDAVEERKDFAVEVDEAAADGPWASAVLTTLLRLWLPQSRKNRKPPFWGRGCRRAR